MRLIALLCFGSALSSIAGHAQCTVTSFTPTSAAQGAVFSFTANVFACRLPPTGLQFNPGVGITVIGLTSSVGQVSATVSIAPNAPVGPQQVIATFATGAPPVTAKQPFLVTSAPPSVSPPTLTSVGPGLVSQGAHNVRLSLIGSNFQPRAAVVISPPLPTPAASNARTQATDIAIQSVTQVSSSLLLVEISVDGQAASGVRAVDVVNPDGSSTGPPSLFGNVTLPGSRTSQPLHVSFSNSLAAPLEVTTIVITHPRNGTIVTQGDDIYGEAILGGVGSGLIVGNWLWDGAPLEQFEVHMTGGERTTLRTSRSLPTLSLGQHTLTLSITAPNQLQSRDVQVVVNPGDWKLEKMYAPAFGAGFLPDSPPLFRWAMVPGAARYQVGFSLQPFFNTIQRWYDAYDVQWQARKDVWAGLPEGELYWTVRVVEVSGETRKPLPMRRIWKLPEGALLPAGAPGKTPAGAVLLSWQGLRGQAIYRVTISRDADGIQVVRRYFTATRSIDLHSIQTSLQPGETYFWQVEAFSPEGYKFLTSPRQSFVLPATSGAMRPKFNAYQVAALGPLPAPPTLGSQIASRAPAPNSTVHDNLAPIRIDFRNSVKITDVVLMVDDTDVTGLSQISDTRVFFKPVIPLDNGTHQVTVSVGADSDQWTYTVQQQQQEQSISPILPAQSSDAEVPPPPSPPSGGSTPAASGNTGSAGQPSATSGQPSATSSTAKSTPPKSAVSPSTTISQEFSTQLSSNTQWISGSAPDTNALGITTHELDRFGAWTSDVNGSGLLSSVLGPDPKHALGRFNDYVMRLAYDQTQWGLNLRFGVIAPALYTNSEFVTTGSPREGVEPSLRTPAGTFAFFANTDDNALGGGNGLAFHQEVRGASYEAPIPKPTATLRFMWLSARDIGAPSIISFTPTGFPITNQPLQTPPFPGIQPVSAFLPNASAGDAYGGLFQLHLGKDWLWNSEYALSYDNPDLASLSHRLFGRAWRTGINGSWEKINLSFAYRDVGPNFATPANPSLTLNSNPNRRGIDASASRTFSFGTFTAAYQYLQSDVRNPNKPPLSLHNVTGGWSKSLTKTTTLQIGGREMRTFTGTLPPLVQALTPDQQLALRSDQRDTGGNIGISQRVSSLTLTATGTRDWFRNRLVANQNVITSGLNFGASWQGSSFFRINSNVSLNWISAEKFTVGQTRVVTTYLQPMLTWQKAGVSISPLITVSNNATELGTGVFTTRGYSSQYLARLSWQMPGVMKFSNLSLEGGQTHTRDAIANTGRTDPRVLLVWNIVWGYRYAPASAGR